ncbi:MAG: SIS domain-containing protein [Anaerolineales bacterium]
MLAVLKDARRQKALTLAITNEPESPMAKGADYQIPTDAREERSVAAYLKF